MSVTTRVTVVDPYSATVGSGTLELDQGRGHVTRGLRAGDFKPTENLCFSPGWIDLHTHVFDGSTEIAVAPDDVGLGQGVHVVADAGTSGANTFAGMKRYVIPSAETQVVCWLNIGLHGLVHLREVSEPDFFDVDKTIACVQTNKDIIRGIKVRSSGVMTGGMGLIPVKLAKLVADECDVPVMVHIGEAPPVVADVIDVLGAGDVITHCFHGKSGTPWHNGAPIANLQRAIDRGVRLDVGHGAASFSYRVAAEAIANGYLPQSISTDIHVRNLHGPVFSLANVMTKMLACGLDLEAVVAAVTKGPAEVLRLEPDHTWLSGDRVETGTVFSIDPAGTQSEYVDVYGASLPVRQVIRVHGVLVGGQYRSITSGPKLAL